MRCALMCEHQNDAHYGHHELGSDCSPPLFGRCCAASRLLMHFLDRACGSVPGTSVLRVSDTRTQNPQYLSSKALILHVKKVEVDVVLIHRTDIQATAPPGNCAILVNYQTCIAKSKTRTRLSVGIAPLPVDLTLLVAAQYRNVTWHHAGRERVDSDVETRHCQANFERFGPELTQARR
eukprot:2104481-Rhodomonas_salina.2